MSHIRRVLVINPNTSTSITKSFEPILSELDLVDTAFTYWTSPKGPAIIKSETDLYESASQCLPLILEIADEFDGFLAACYADHPLVRMLQCCVEGKPVVGIFDASIFASLQLLDAQSTFGIVTTGTVYEALLTQGVELLLETDKELARFSGVCASGIGLSDLLPESQEVTRQKIVAATRRLIQSSGGTLQVVCMGGVILAGMERWVHEACGLELGLRRGQKIQVVDQLLAGMLTLDALLDHIPLHSVDYRQALR